MNKITRQLLEDYWRICQRELARADEDFEYTKENAIKYGVRFWAEGIESNQVRVDKWTKKLEQPNKELKAR